MRKIDILLAPSREYSSLVGKGYYCFNVVGQNKEEEENRGQRINNVNACQYLYDYESRDYLSATNGYMYLLHSKQEDIFTHIKALIGQGDSNVDKIAFLGRNTLGYCWRYAFSYFFASRVAFYLPNFKIQSIKSRGGITFKEYNNICYTDEYWKQVPIKIIEPQAQGMLERSKWIYTKEIQNPHLHTLRKEWEKNKDFIQVVSYIRTYGIPERVQNVYRRVLRIGNYKYWTSAKYRWNEDVEEIHRTDIK